MQEPTTSSHSNLRRKIAALFEVLGVLIAGNFVSGKLLPLLGVKSLGALYQPVSTSVGPDFIALSIGWLKVILVQYACLLLPAFAIGWWRHRFRLSHYGVTTAGQPIWRLVGMGMLLFALAAMPLKLLWIAKRFFALGPQPAFWALLDNNWTPSFWLFLAVSSFVVTPIFEELFYRGYCQARLEEDFGGVGAIVIVALFMTLGHTQYQHANILSIGTIVCLIPMMLGLGYAYWRTRSLIPAVILHMMINLPTKGIYDFILPVLMVCALILFWKQVRTMTRDFWCEWSAKGWKTAAFFAAVIAVILVVGFESQLGVFIVIGFLCLGSALWMEYREKRSSL